MLLKGQSTNTDSVAKPLPEEKRRKFKTCNLPDRTDLTSQKLNNFSKSVVLQFNELSRFVDSRHSEVSQLQAKLLQIICLKNKVNWTDPFYAFPLIDGNTGVNLFDSSLRPIHSLWS